MKITMDGEYALREDPYTPVRILCVDRPKTNLPVIVLTSEGELRTTQSDGKYFSNPPEHPFDLVPLQEKPREYWAVLYPSGNVWQIKDKKEDAETTAEGMSNSRSVAGTFTVVQMKPVVS